MKTLIASSIAVFVFASAGLPAQAAVSSRSEVRPVVSDTSNKTGDPVRIARRGADDPAGHTRRGRGADDPAGHVRGGHGADDPVGHG